MEIKPLSHKQIEAAAKIYNGCSKPLLTYLIYLQ